MRLIFAGTPEFAAQALRAIVAAGHQVPLVLTQPDRAAGRGMKLRPSPVKIVGQAIGSEVFQPASLKGETAQERIRQAAAAVMVVAAYGLILPQAVLDVPTLGCINIHASLLPRWRGAAPIQRAILAGDAETGISIMQMDAGLDSGPVLRSEAVTITDDDTAASLHDRLAALGARLVVETLARLPLDGQIQSADGVSYAKKIDKAEAILDWRQPAAQLARQVRAFDPFPGAICSIGGHVLKVWRARAVAGGVAGVPGVVLAADREGINVACSEGVLCILEVQKAGGRRLSVADFLAGAALAPGTECACLADC